MSKEQHDYSRWLHDLKWWVNRKYKTKLHVGYNAFLDVYYTFIHSTAENKFSIRSNRSKTDWGALEKALFQILMQIK